MAEIFSNVKFGDDLPSVTIHYGGGKKAFDAIRRLGKGAY
jgi:hypothetical protein